MPSLNQLVKLSAVTERPLARSTISDKLNAKSMPQWEFVIGYVRRARRSEDRLVAAAWPRP